MTDPINRRPLSYQNDDPATRHRVWSRPVTVIEHKTYEEMLAEEGSIDLGNGTFYKKSVDREDNWIAITHWHKNPEGKLCGGWVPFNVESKYVLPGTPKWEAESYEPLTMSPSLLCGCGNHGFIRNGRWEPC